MKLIVALLLLGILTPAVFSDTRVKRDCCCDSNNECDSPCSTPCNKYRSTSNCNRKPCNNARNCEPCSRNTDDDDDKPIYVPVGIPVPSNSEKIQAPNGATYVNNTNINNHTLELSLTNVVNTVNNISIPINVNSTNENTITVVLAPAKEEAINITQNNCCYITRTVCDRNNRNCVARRNWECSDLCRGDYEIIPDPTTPPTTWSPYPTPTWSPYPPTPTSPQPPTTTTTTPPPTTTTKPGCRYFYYVIYLPRPMPCSQQGCYPSCTPPYYWVRASSCNGGFAYAMSNARQSQMPLTNALPLTNCQIAQLQQHQPQMPQYTQPQRVQLLEMPGTPKCNSQTTPCQMSQQQQLFTPQLIPQYVQPVQAQVSPFPQQQFVEMPSKCNSQTPCQISQQQLFTAAQIPQYVPSGHDQFQTLPHQQFVQMPELDSKLPVQFDQNQILPFNINPQNIQPQTENAYYPFQMGPNGQDVYSYNNQFERMPRASSSQGNEDIKLEGNGEEYLNQY